jgi:2',3'-cyclic-nucleotide 2'-phosphodiesterase/3'-nucleotidase
MRIGRRGLLRTTGGALAAAAAPHALNAASGAMIHLRILETSDLHVFADAFDYYHDKPDPTVGLSSVAALIRAARAEAANTLLFDNGDLIQGSPLGDYVAEKARPGPGHVHPMFRAMNLLGYDAATIGNHEFNFGLDFLERSLAGAGFPLVCANVEHADGRAFLQPTAVLERDVRADDGSMRRLRIGVIGLVTPQLMLWDKAKLEGRLRSGDIVDAARRHLPALRERSDIVVALCHSGISSLPRQGGEENAALYLAEVAGIDAILTGHSHRVFPGPDYAGRPGVDAARGTLHGVPAVMPGFWGSHLGVIDLVLRQDGDRWRRTDFAVEARPIYRRAAGRAEPLVSEDAAVLAAVAPEHAATRKWVAQPVGRLARPVTSYFALIGDTSVVDLINAAQLWYAAPLLAAGEHAGVPILSAAAAFKAGGLSPDMFTDLPAGPIAVNGVADIYVYPNTLVAVRVSGAIVKAWLERAAGVFNRVDPARTMPQELINAHVPAYNFDVISGVTYRIDLSQPVRYGAGGELLAPDAQRIVDLRYRDRPIDPGQAFVVVTNNYRADGGGKFPGLDGSNVVLRAPDLNRDVLLRYIAEQGVVDPGDRPAWSFAPLGRKLLVTFNSGPGALARLGDRPGLRRLPDRTDGFVRLALELD